MEHFLLGCLNSLPNKLSNFVLLVFARKESDLRPSNWKITLWKYDFESFYFVESKKVTIVASMPESPFMDEGGVAPENEDDKSALRLTQSCAYK